jgi:hypothetical protein
MPLETPGTAPRGDARRRSHSNPVAGCVTPGRTRASTPFSRSRSAAYRLSRSTARTGLSFSSSSGAVAISAPPWSTVATASPRRGSPARPAARSRCCESVPAASHKTTAIRRLRDLFDGRRGVGAVASPLPVGCLTRRGRSRAPRDRSITWPEAAALLGCRLAYC